VVLGLNGCVGEIADINATFGKELTTRCTQRLHRISTLVHKYIIG